MSKVRFHGHMRPTNRRIYFGRRRSWRDGPIPDWLAAILIGILMSAGPLMHVLFRW